MSEIPSKKEIGINGPADASLRQMNRRELGKIAFAGAVGVALDWSHAGLAMAQTQPPSQHGLVLEGATLIDGTGKAPMPNAVIVVDGTRIKAVGQRGQVPYPAKATVLKLDGLTVLPGLIDCHVHSQDWHMPMFPHYGVTTMLDKNIDATWILAQRELLRKGIIEKGPRMFVSGSVMHGVYGFKQPWDTWNYPDVTTVEEARAYAQSMVALGVDVLSVNQNITDDQLRAAMEVAQEASLPIFGHTRNIRRVAELGFKIAEHMFTIAYALIDPEAKQPPEEGGPAAGPGYVPPEARMDPKLYPPLIDFMIEKGVYVNPTLVNEWRAATPWGQKYANDAVQMIKDPGLAFVPEDVREGWTHVPKRIPPGYDNVKEFLRQYSEAGGKIVVGTDAHINAIPGLSAHQEMQMLVEETGVPPMKAIQGATLWNAELIKKDKDLGSVESGKVADFLVIQGNPLTDITATQNVHMVIKDGVVLDTSYDPKWVNPIPQPYSVYTHAGKPDPVITKVSPPIVRQGGQTVTLQIEGQRFYPNAIVRFDDKDLPTSFVSATALTATLDASLLQRAPGSYALYVLNPGLHGTVSQTGYLVIDTDSNPVSSIPQPYSVYAKDPPQIYGPTPRSAREDGKTIDLEIDGTKFGQNAVIRFDEASLPTRFVSSTKLTATLDSRLLKRSPGGYVLYVVNPGLNGNVSAPAYFLVDLKN
ncbi:MAG TPA: amidohydrolase family protein [Candidatus Acidoferrum sp.]|nr:amidohydrolase family protein [Candidatus Acidoferrum sp.]